MAYETTVDAGTRIAQIADELRALAQNGLHYSRNEYDIERFHTIMSLAAELFAVVDTRDPSEIASTFRGELGLRTPLVAADAAIFDGEGRILLTQRADSGTWCMPGGAADVGEAPSAAAEREAREETGLQVRAHRLLGLWDNRTLGSASAVGHAYYLLFECRVLGGELSTSIETTDFIWASEEQAATLPLFGTHTYKVPEAFRLHRAPTAPTAFH